MKLTSPISIDSLSPQIAQPPNVQLSNAITSAGIEPPDDLIFDGVLHRFSSNGKSGDRSGWYVAHNDQFAVATFGCWRMDLLVNWRADIGRSLTYVEQMAFNRRMAEGKAKRDAEKFERNESAAKTAENLLINSTQADDSHPYLVLKGIKAHGARVSGDGRLMIPVASDGHEKIISLQYIDDDGGKMFLSGGAVTGGWWHIGKFIGAEHVFIAEGYATAASIHESTGKPCAIAFNAGQIKACAIKVRELVGDLCTITICADLDPSGIGETKSNEAAQAIGAKVVVSPVSSDFNDAVVKAGIDIESILCPQNHNHDWLIHAGELVQSQIYVKWLVKRWIPKNSLIMLHGASGSGKSLIVMDMVCRVALPHEGEWMGFKVRPGSVIYLAGEGYIGMNARLKAWAEHNEVDATTLNMWISKSGCDLNHASGYQLARESILALKQMPAIIVVDTLHRFMTGDENSAQDAGEMIKACNRLMAEFNCSVLLVHHTGVSDAAQGRARGSSAWKGAMESEINVVPQIDENPLEIVNVKSKDSALAQTQYMRIQSHKFDGWIDEDGDAITGAVVIEAEKGAEKESKAQAKDKKEFARVAKVIHNLLPDGRVFVSENDWSDATIDENGAKTTALRQSRARMKKRMIEDGLLEPVTNGYAANFPIDFI